MLSSLADGGDMHGYQLRQIAEKEHVEMWSDITPGGLYGAIKRLAKESLIERWRTGQVGGYPERQCWTITRPG